MTIVEVTKVIVEKGFKAIECKKKILNNGWYVLPEKGKELVNFTDYDFRIKEEYKEKEDVQL